MNRSRRGLYFAVGLVVVASTMLPGCSGGSIPANSPSPIPRIVTRNTMVQKQSVFLGFSDAAKRISWFDSTDLSETRHYDAGDEVLAVTATPNLDSTAVVEARRLIIHDSSAAGGMLEFSIPDQINAKNWMMASNAAAFAFIAEGGASMKVIRYVGSGAWQEKLLTLPASIAGVDARPFVSKDGVHFGIRSRKGGSYAVYTAPAGVNDAWDNPLECVPASDLGFEVTETFFHAASGRLFIGGKNGALRSFKPRSSAGCIAPAAWLDSSLAGGSDVSAMFDPGDAELGVVSGSLGRGATIMSISDTAVSAVGNDLLGGTFDDCAVAGAAKIDTMPASFASSRIYLSLCDPSYIGIAYQLRIGGLLHDGTRFSAEFPGSYSAEEIGAMAVDPAIGEVFIQFNDARGRVAKWKPATDSVSYQEQWRENVFLSNFF